MPSNAMRVSRGELARMKRLASNKVIKSDREKARDAMRLKSQERESGWPNTLSAQRKAKYDQRKLREDAEEAARVKIDEMEESRRQAARKKSIDRANKLLYEQKDLMKRFRSQQMLSDIIYEQQLQIDQVKQKKLVEKKRDEYFFNQSMRLRDEAIKKDQEKVAARLASAKKVAAQQQEQLKDYTKRHLEAMVQRRMEGAMIAQKAKSDMAEDQAKKDARRRAARQNNMDMTRANEELKEMNKVRDAFLAREMAKIKQYAADKEATEARRKAHVIRKNKAKHAKVQRMIDRATEHLNNMQNTEDTRLERQVAEKRAKDDAEHARKEKYRQDMIIAIDKSRNLQLTRKRADRQRDTDEDNELVRKWRQQNNRMNEQAERERLARVKLAVEVQTFQLNQTTAVKTQRAANRKKELAEAKAKAKAMRDEETGVYDRVKGEIAEYTKAGKNTSTMMASLQPKDEIKGFVFF